MWIGARYGLLGNSAAQPDSIYDAGVIQLVAIDDVLITGRAQVVCKQTRKECLVGGKRRRMQNACLAPYELGNPLFQIEMNGLSPAQEADRCEAVAPLVQGSASG